MASANSLNLVGMTFGRLSVISKANTRIYKSGGKKTAFLCRCSCGNEVEVLGSSLTKGQQSCGCLKNEKFIERSTSHGMTKTKTFVTWCAMKTRCNNKNASSYVNYGGRGIKVCDDWNNSFEAFLRDMGEKPSDEFSIERINVNGNYEPSNCKWATKKEQVRNKRSNRFITFNGITKTLVEWAESLKMDQASLRERLQKWSLEKALTTPKKELVL